ncbi:hypothetical protein ACFY3G_53110, partial [Streptomyces phaeochromogenes]|uniref:hypothetical protein n=1 Tax=Streptomyces phaeochromogenes TaxID=1923 RepID=UPI0036B6BC5C
MAAVAATATLLAGGGFTGEAASAAPGSPTAATPKVRSSKPLKPERPMTLKERRAQVDEMRAPKEPGTTISLPGRKTLESGTPAPMVSLVVVYAISGRECAGVCPGRTPTGGYRSL